MAPEIDLRERLEVKMEASPYKSNDVFAKELEEELMKFTTVSDDSKVDEHVVEKTEEVNGSVDVEVDIMDSKQSDVSELVEVERQETTESSSSFDGGGSEDDTLADAEAISNVRGDAESSLVFDGLSNTCKTRQRKLTSHWSSYIRPLRWRCKWVELQIKKLESQAQKYERKLQEYSQQKHIQLENASLESIGGKLLPVPQKNARNEILRRKKRKRTEETTDIATYMSNHNLFSYYENRKSFTEGASMDKSKNPAKTTQQANIDDGSWIENEPFLLEAEDGDNAVELLLRKIFSLQSYIESMRGRIDKVINEHAIDFPENWNVPMPCDALLGNTALPNNGDVSVPESVGEVLSDVNGSRDLIHFPDVLVPGEGGVVIDNAKVKR